MKVGSIVKCLTDGTWNTTDENGNELIDHINYGPYYNEILVVDGIDIKWGLIWLSFEEYPEVDEYGERYFFILQEDHGKVNFVEVQPPMEIKVEDLIEEPKVC